jgi:hypothetical protein
VTANRDRTRTHDDGVDAHGPNLELDEHRRVAFHVELKLAGLVTQRGNRDYMQSNRNIGQPEFAVTTRDRATDPWHRDVGCNPVARTKLDHAALNHDALLGNRRGAETGYHHQAASNDSRRPAGQL